jgi:hypothetical protein
MKLNELVSELFVGTVITAAAAFGAASSAEAQVPSNCMPATCGPKVEIRYEAVTEMVTVPTTICERQEFRYQVQVPITVMQTQERTGFRDVQKTVCKQVPVTRYIPHQVCIEPEPQPCAPACEPQFVPNTCATQCWPNACNPRQNDWYPGKYFGEFERKVESVKHGVHGKILDWRIQHNEKQLGRLYDKRANLNEHSQPYRTPGYGYGNGIMPGFQRVVQGPAVYAAPACATPCGPNACSAPGYNQNWSSPSYNQSWSSPSGNVPNYAPTPAQRPAPSYQQPVPPAPQPMLDQTPQGNQTGFTADKVTLNEGWIPAR